jgi:hypothetical protein
MLDEWRATVEHFAQYESEIVEGNWTFRDVTAHLNGWREWTARRLESAASDFQTPQEPWPHEMSEETIEGVDEINAWFVEAREPKDLSGLIDETEQQFARIFATLATLSEESLAATPTWLDGYPVEAVLVGCLEHWIEHRDLLNAWLESRNR